jgi:hypothetical protein
MITNKARAKQAERLQAQCDAWNDKYPVGVKVVVSRDNGEQYPTTTRSTAQVLQGHSAVIWVYGITGCYSLDRVRPADAA